MRRQCRYQPLSNQPLVLVLCQIRISPIAEMAKYIPAIQEHFRLNGYPLDYSGEIQHFTIESTGMLHASKRQKWEYRSRAEDWNILLLQDSIVLQTFAYTKFEDFIDKLRMVATTILSETKHDPNGVVQRIGLRYINIIQPREREDFRLYLQPGLHGLPDETFDDESQVRIENVGRTQVGTKQATMVVRISQNNQGKDLPPDLIDLAPSKRASRAKVGKSVTLIDLDHYLTYENNPIPKFDWIEEDLYKLHDQIIETFHTHVVTKEAIEIWT